MKLLCMASMLGTVLGGFFIGRLSVNINHQAHAAIRPMGSMEESFHEPDFDIHQFRESQPNEVQ